MKIHEYQAKDLFRQQGIAVPMGKVASSPEEALAVADGLGGYPLVVKAQIHAGGRGKGGGVKLAHDRQELVAQATAILGMNLITKQTGAGGKKVAKVLVEQGLNIRRELYLALLIDRDSAAIMVMVSEAGGMDIEKVAQHTPQKIVKLAIHPLLGPQPFHLRLASTALGLQGESCQAFGRLLARLFAFFMAYDCSLVEINPLVVTVDEQVVALDAKVDLDGNGLFRHPDLRELRDESEEDPLEVAASRFNLNYINLDGNVGNMVNGAGLAMATMDIIKQAGAAPANFLDVGGGADAEMVAKGFELICADNKVKAVLINIFGGILRCDVLAQGVVMAASRVERQLPVVVRMEGTNVEEGRKMLASSGLDLRVAKDLADAAQQVANLVRGEA